MHLRFLFLALFLGARATLACQCGHRPTAVEALPEVSAVFDGSAVARTPFLARVYGYLVVLERIDFDVHEAWRGPNQPRVTIVSGFSNCDVLFHVGTRYLVFARPFENSALGLGSSICLPTESHSRSFVALRDLGAGLAFTPYQVRSAEAAPIRWRRIAHASLLYGIVTSSALFSGEGSPEARWRAWAPLSPFVALAAACVLLLLLRRRRYRLVLVLVPVSFLAVMLSLAFQGLLTIQFEPTLAHWILSTPSGA